MPAGDVLREFLEKRRARWREEGRRQGVDEGRRQGREEGREEGRRETLREIYGPDYSDSQEGTHPQPPDTDNTNGADEGDVNR